MSANIHNDVTITSFITLTVASSASQAFSHTASLGSFKHSVVKISSCGMCSVRSAVLRSHSEYNRAIAAARASGLSFWAALHSSSISIVGPGAFCTLSTTPSAAAHVSSSEVLRRELISAWIIRPKCLCRASPVSHKTEKIIGRCSHNMAVRVTECHAKSIIGHGLVCSQSRVWRLNL